MDTMQLTDKNKPSGRGDGLCSCTSQYSPGSANWRRTVNWLGSPLESKNISIAGSQVPRSMKNLKGIESAGARHALGALFTVEC